MDDKLADQPAGSSERDQVVAGTTMTAKRQQLSCSVCRIRKVKCDRVQPCEACCAHGRPGDCVFLIRPEDSKPMKQWDEIRKLRDEVDKLKMMGNNESIVQHTTVVQRSGTNSLAVGSSKTDSMLIDAGAIQPNESHTLLEAIFNSIKFAPNQKAQDIVHQIRSNHSVESIAASAATPAFSPSHIDVSEATQEGVKGLATVESCADIIGVAQDNCTPRRLPAKNMSKIKARSADAIGKKRSVARRGLSDIMSETSRKHRWIQRIKTVDRTQADKCRAQMTQAQRNFRLLKENTIQSFQHKVSSVGEAISQSNKAFLEFQEEILAKVILDQAPELSHSPKSVNEATTSRTSLMAIDQDVGGNNTVPSPFHDHKSKNSNMSKIKIQAGERTRREGGVHGRRMAGQIYYSFNPPFLRHVPDTPVYDALLERFLDAHSPVMPYYSGASDLIRAAAASRTSSPILSMAFHSLCVVYYGQVVGNLGVVILGHRIYSKVLNTLQNAHSSPEECRSIWVLLTVIVLTAYESLQHSSSGSVIKHFMGALKLLEFRGPCEHMSGLGHICYVQYRSHWVAAALICRSRTFLASKAWKAIPWSAKSSTEGFMQNLLDQIVDIPALLERFDNITKSIKTGILSPFEALDQQALLQTAVADVKYRLHQWEKSWVESCPAGQLYEVPANTEDYFPIFRCRDTTTGNIMTPTIFACSNHEIIRTTCIYYSAVVILLGVDTRPDELKLPERYRYACLVCRSLEYYIRSVPMNLMNGFGFFLRVAHDAFPKGDIEIEWVEEVFKRVAKETTVKVLGSKVPEFSV